MIRTIVVDDEPNVREDLENKISADGAFEIVGSCANALEAMREINSKYPDVVFLDIKMPKISGIEMLAMLDEQSMPRIVFVTAYGEHAIEAFEKNAIDFLLKPVKNDRLVVTLERLKRNCRPQSAVSNITPPELYLVPCYRGSKDFAININNIVHIYSSPATGAHVITDREEPEYHTTVTLELLAMRSGLMQCHRQHLVNPNQIRTIEKLENGLGQIITQGGHVIPVSRNHMKKFLK